MSFGRSCSEVWTASGRTCLRPPLLAKAAGRGIVPFILFYSCIAPYMSRRRSGSAVRNRTGSNASGSVISSGPPSPTFTATTSASQVHLDAGPETIITRRDLRLSVNAYEDVCTHF